MELAQGQIWKEINPRFERYIRIEHIAHGRRSIHTRTVVKDGDHWIKAPRSRLSYCDPDRFNGKRNGYAFHEAAT